MIKHKCYFIHVLKVKCKMKLTSHFEAKIHLIIFGHFLNYDSITVDNALLDDFVEDGSKG